MPVDSVSAPSAIGELTYLAVAAQMATKAPQAAAPAVQAVESAGTDAADEGRLDTYA